MSETVTATLENGVGTLRFLSAKANALSSSMLRIMLQKLMELSANPECKVLVIASTGKTFCAGALFDEMKSVKTEEEAIEFFSLFGRLTLALRTAQQPVIARVQGKAAGGGVGILAAVDYALGTPAAAVKLSELQIGLAPLAISPVLIWKLGKARALELSLAADWRDAAWCLNSGMLSELLASEAELDIRLAQISEQFTSYNQLALSSLKQLCTDSVSISEMEIRAKINGQVLLKQSLTL